MDVILSRKFVGEVLMSSEIKRAVGDLAEIAEKLFQAEVAKRTGALADSAEASTEIGGMEKDRWIGVLTVGGAGAPYAASNQFGAGGHPGSTGKHHNAAAEDLNTVLGQLGAQ